MPLNSSSPEIALRFFQKLRWKAIEENKKKLLARCENQIRRFKKEIQKRKRAFNEEYMNSLLDLQQ